MKKHIPTLTLVFYKSQDLYGYEYDDENGNTQADCGYGSVGDALGNAFKRIKTFLVLPDVEVK